MPCYVRSVIHFLGAATARSTPSAVSAPTTFASLRKVEVCQLKLHPPRLDLREVQDVVDQGQQMRARCVNIFEVLLGARVGLQMPKRLPAPGGVPEAGPERVIPCLADGAAAERVEPAKEVGAADPLHRLAGRAAAHRQDDGAADKARAARSCGSQGGGPGRPR